MKDFKGTDLQAFRKKHNVTQQRLSELLGVDIRTVQNYESNSPIPKSKQKLVAYIFSSHEEEARKSDLSIGLPKEEILTLTEKFNNITDTDLINYLKLKSTHLLKNERFKNYLITITLKELENSLKKELKN